MALLLACVLLLVSLRSRYVCDEFLFSVNRRQYDICSFHGQLWWQSWSILDSESPVHDWSSDPFDDPILENLRHEIEDQRRWLSGRDLYDLEFDYARLTIPITVLAAYLILWKPRTKPREQQDA